MLVIVLTVSWDYLGLLGILADPRKCEFDHPNLLQKYYTWMNSYAEN